MIRQTIERAKRRLVGPPDRLPQRALMALILLTVAIAATGGWYALSSGVDTGTSSLPYLRPFLALATSVWAWILGLVWLLRRVLVHRDKQYAKQAASVTGYEPRSVRRLAYESKSPDGSTRVIASTGDEPEEIEERILSALESGEDDGIKLNPEVVSEGEEGLQEAVEDDVGLEDVSEVEAETDRSRERSLARRAGRFVLGVGLISVAAVLALAGWHALVLVGTRVGVGSMIPVDYLWLAATPPAYFVVATAVVTIVALWEIFAAWRRHVDRRQDAADGAADGSADGAAGGSAGGNEIEPEPDPDDLEDGLEDDVRDPWREELKLFRLDLASTVNFSEITWQLLLPAGVATVIMLLAVQLWVQPWVYPAIFAAGLLVGILNYVRVSWKRSRRLKALRQERESVSWSDVSVLVKEVEVAETRIYYAWMGDAEPRRYAHDNRAEFAEEVAHRAYELVEGVPVSPSVMEKQASELEKMHPDLHGFRDTETEAIMTWLLEHVEDSQHGLIPKAKLIEDCVEHDLQGRRFGPGRRGEGYDPDLVREAYRELVPAALVEQEVDVSREDVDGDQEEALTLIAVRLRTDPLPPEYGQIRAAFSSKFGNYARWTPMYELPDVSDRLGGDPEYVSSLQRREVST